MSGPERGGRSGVDRREFLKATGAALLAGGLAGCASLATVPVQPRRGRVRLAVRNYPELAEPGGFLRIRPAGHPTHLLVLALGAGRFAVLSPVCTHRQCLVEVGGRRLVCPCHGSEYDRDGRVLVGPAERPLVRYPAELDEGDELVIDLGEAA